MLRQLIFVLGMIIISGGLQVSNNYRKNMLKVAAVVVMEIGILMMIFFITFQIGLEEIKKDPEGVVNFKTLVLDSRFVLLILAFLLFVKDTFRTLVDLGEQFQSNIQRETEKVFTNKGSERFK